jgi:hypothetical protein
VQQSFRPPDITADLQITNNSSRTRLLTLITPFHFEDERSATVTCREAEMPVKPIRSGESTSVTLNFDVTNPGRHFLPRLQLLDQATGEIFVMAKRCAILAEAPRQSFSRDR